MSIVYQVRRPEPLPVSKTLLKCKYSGTLDQFDEYDETFPEAGNDPEDRWVKDIYATITGWDDASNKRIHIGQMKAHLVQLSEVEDNGLW